MTFNETQTLPFLAETRNSVGSAKHPHPKWLRDFLEKGRKDRTVTIMKISPEKAAHLLTLNTYNRPLTPGRVAKYAGMMSAGNWKLTAEGIAVSDTGVLVNGQHRLHAICESGVTVEFTVWFGVDAEEFSVVDQGTQRSASDIAHIRGMTYCKQRAALARRILVIEKQITRGVPSVSDVDRKMQELVGEDTEEALRCGHQAVRVVGVGTAQIAYWWITQKTKHPHKLDEFWEKFTTGADLGSSDPILRLRDMLMFRAPGHASHRWCKDAAAIILTWNAWLVGRRKATFTWPHSIQLPEAL